MKTILIITTVCLCCVSSTFAQSKIELTPGQPDRFRDLLITPISAVSKIALPQQKINVVGTPGYLTSFRASGDGNIIISNGDGRFLDRSMTNARLDTSLNVSEPNLNVGYYVSNNGNWLIRILYNTELDQSEMQYIDFVTKQIMYTFELEGAFGETAFSSDANTFAHISKSSRSLVTRKGSEFQTDLVPNTKGNPIISSSGDRVFTEIEFEDESRRHALIERSADGWSEPSFFSLYDHDLNELEFKIRDVANDGDTLLIRAESRGLAVVNGKNNEWGLPEFLDFQWQLPFSNRYSISEDGNVVLIESLREEDGIIDYIDLFLFIKQDDGEWKQQKVNPDGVDASPGAILTKDGSKVFWIPWQTMSSVEYDVYK
ncbi:MAG: hypothetical protein P9L94_17720 [Candidatus Hinthialibacter antarcticus]|nr:hypothetical protein [Candidatus Hinthialibacter antarcticus]